MTEFDELYQTYFGDVFRYLQRLSGNDSVAEELTSDTFFKAMGAIDTFRGDCSVRVWLCQIAKNSYFSHAKKHGRQLNINEEQIKQLPDPSPSMEDTVIRQSEAERAGAILHELAEPYKEVFMLRVYGELSFAKIGKLFGKTQNWACVTYHRAKQKIKERMEASS